MTNEEALNKILTEVIVNVATINPSADFTKTAENAAKAYKAGLAAYQAQVSPEEKLMARLV